MTPAALPLCPFPPLHWWTAAAEGGVMDVQERWVKGSSRNRCLLADARGPFFWTVPVVHPGNAAVKEVRISGHIPLRKLWRTVETAYRAAPYFDQIEAELAPILEDHLREGVPLGVFSVACLAWTSRWIGVPVPAAAEAPMPWGGPGKDLRSREALERPTPPAVPYPRVFMDRVPFPQGLSVLDALLHLGPAVGDVLSRHGTPHDPAGHHAAAR